MERECKFKPTTREGLYFFVLVIFLICSHTCSVTERMEKVQNEIKISIENLQK